MRDRTGQHDGEDPVEEEEEADEEGMEEDDHHASLSPDPAYVRPTKANTHVATRMPSSAQMESKTAQQRDLDDEWGLTRSPARSDRYDSDGGFIERDDEGDSEQDEEDFRVGFNSLAPT